MGKNVEIGVSRGRAICLMWIIELTGEQMAKLHMEFGAVKQYPIPFPCSLPKLPFEAVLFEFDSTLNVWLQVFCLASISKTTKTNEQTNEWKKIK